MHYSSIQENQVKFNSIDNAMIIHMHYSYTLLPRKICKI